MEKFPNIQEGQVVLLRAESKTGHVLDELFNVAINETQKVFTIFDSVEDGLVAAKTILKEKGYLVECIVYGENQELIYYLNPYDEETHE